jgi:hypothetical protein
VCDQQRYRERERERERDARLDVDGFIFVLRKCEAYWAAARLLLLFQALHAY